jgi:hypothetical protein
VNRHIILTHGRSGSNNLANTLNLHPRVVNYGEVLGPWTAPRRLHGEVRRVWASDTSDYLEYVYSSRTFFYGAQLYSALSHLRKRKRLNLKSLRDVTNIGIKDFVAQFQRDPGALDFLAERKDIAVIRLHRENLLRRYVSLLSMRRNGVVAAEGETRRLGKVTVGVQEMLQDLELMEQQQGYEMSMMARLRGHRLFVLKYEDYFASAESMAAGNKGLFEFLGVPPVAERSAHHKILPRDWTEIVDNYDEFRRAVINTRYEKYLDS